MTVDPAPAVRSARQWFELCLGQAPEARAALLARSGADPLMQARVLALLAHADAPCPALDGGLAALAGPLLSEHALERPERIGPYKVLAELGRGGMGAVYLGERDDGDFRLRAAIKVIDGARGRADAIRRFLQERRLLAGLRHPHIASLLDGGVDVSGDPWFALEYIDGNPITDWCDGRRLDLRGRIACFEQVLDAVAYAHRQLVVHRDLKPSNVMVTEAGAVKLLDFGIARTLDADDGETLTQSTLMTPRYAAPEQVRGERATTATDIYSLGVMLCELLSGSSPYPSAAPPPALDGQADGQPRPAQAINRHQLARAIVDEEPLTLTQALARDPAAAAALRSSAPAALRRELAGDLEHVVARCLEKAPAQRYSSIEALAEDLRAWRHGLPLRSRRTSRLRRALKFAARHRYAMTAAVGLLAVAGAGIAATLWQAAEAQRQAQVSSEVRAFLIEMLRGAAPEQALGRERSVREVLDEASARIEPDLTDAGLAVPLLSDVGDVYRALGDSERAGTLLARAVALSEADGVALLDRALALQRLAYLKVESGEADGALPLIDAAIALAGASAPLKLQVDCLLVRSMVQAGLGDEPAAMQAALQALATVESAADAEPELRIDVYSILANRYNTAGRVAEALRWNREVYETTRELYGDRHPHTATEQQNLAIALQQGSGDYLEVERLFRGALAVREAILGTEHPHSNHLRRELAWNLHLQGRTGESAALYQRVHGWLQTHTPDDANAIAIALNGRAQVHLLAGDAAAAIADADAATRLWTEALGEQHDYVRAAQQTRAQALLAQGDLDQSVLILEQVIAARRASGNGRIASTLRELARALARRGDGAPALRAADEALQLQAARVNHDPRALVWFNVARAEATAALGRTDDAIAMLDGAHAVLREQFPAHPRLADIAALRARFGAGSVR